MAINVFHQSGIRGISNAPVKGQCSRAYFYGSDLELELLFQGVEGDYASIIRKLLQDEESLDAGDLRNLRAFCHLQMGRTEAAVLRTSVMVQGVDEITHRGFEEHRKDALDVSHQTMLNRTLRSYLLQLDSTKDLEVCILTNKTRRDFVTSDDPAILTNRLMVQRLGNTPAGAVSSGTQIFMPLTPRHCLVCYDLASYAAQNRRGYLIPLVKEIDVRAVNELQFIRCKDTIFFRNWGDLPEIQSNFSKSRSRRPSAWVEFWVGLPEKVSGDRRFRAAAPDEIKGAAHKMIVHKNVNVCPSQWLSVLPYRQIIYGLTNGSGLGYVRLGQSQVFSGVRFKKEKIGYKALGPSPEKTLVQGPGNLDYYR